MSKQTSFSHQKQLLSSLLDKTQEVVSALDMLANNYERLVDGMYEDQGLLEEVYFEYKENYLNSLKEALRELVKKIQEENIPFVEKEYDFLSSH